MPAVLQCTFCKQPLKATPFRYCSRPNPPFTQHVRLGDCCDTPQRRKELHDTGWSIGNHWKKPQRSN
jgi:hypothetical protein